MSTGEREPTQPQKAAEPAAAPTTIGATTTTTTNSSSWKLPDGIEDHLEAGLLKAAVGVAVGGALGMLLCKSGKGWRSAAVASGLGVAVGSTYSRAFSSGSTSSSSSKIVAVPQPPARVQTFQTTRPAVVPAAVVASGISRNDSSQTKGAPPSTAGK